MPAKHSTDPSSGGDSAGSEHTRFIVFGGARTGSNMLVFALNSSREIACFGELFRFMDDSIDFRVAGYNKHSAADLELRNGDFSRFLDQRIFVEMRGVVAVGFKIHYTHFFGFPGLKEWLAEQHDIRVVHLRRRNLLRMLVSTEIAKTTGDWIDPVAPSLSNQLEPAKLLNALRHPAHYAARLLQLLRPKPTERKSQREPVTLSPQECKDFFMKTEILIKRYEELFSEHRVLTLFYEDLLGDLRGTLDSAQDFLGVSPQALEIGTKRQNPEPLHMLISNYGELCAAFKGTPCEQFLD